MTPEDLEKPANALQKEILIWYFDRFLPIAAGKDYWGDDIKYYKLPTDKAEIAGEQKTLVTVTSEAFGLLNLENCQEKWVKMYEYKEEHGQDATIPVKGEAAKPFKGKWTDSKCGRIMYGGWAEEAFDSFEGFKKALNDFRKHEADNGYKFLNYVKKLLREKKGIVTEEPKKKRSRRKNPPVVRTQKRRRLSREKDD